MTWVSFVQVGTDLLGSLLLGMFMAIFALRNVLGRVIRAEQRTLRQERPAR